MPNKLLILDDDTDFNSLLTDIFEQADYEVTSVEDPLVAVEVFQESHFDLVVTDHKMPEMTGTEFMRKIKDIRPNTPVIMVSGYLENDAIRNLISDGVGGVFLKPLNIFSLLERTNELLEEAKKLDSRRAPMAVPESVSPTSTGNNLEFHFRSYPCKSEVSYGFAERLYNLRNFKSTLTLCGESGMHFRSICEDIAGFYTKGKDVFLYYTPNTFHSDKVLEQITMAQSSGAERITCVIEKPEEWDSRQKQLASDLPKRMGVFEPFSSDLRAIFCVSSDLDDLFDDGIIDENLYIIMGTAEVKVPPLRECPSDIPILAQKLAVDSFRELRKASVPRIDSVAKDFLSKQEWPHNYQGLRMVIRKSMELIPGDVITLGAVMKACSSTSIVSERDYFVDQLNDVGTELVKSVWLLSNKNAELTAAFFSEKSDAIQKRLND